MRDVEFTVQMLQLVHGRSDEALRTSSTLESLQALAEGGYVSRKQAKKLSWDYRFERVMEHRQQMWALKRTHLFPDLGKANAGGLERKRDITIDELNQNPELRHSRAHFTCIPKNSSTNTMRHVVRCVTCTWTSITGHAAHQRGTRRRTGGTLHEATQERFESIGFADADAAMRHVTALTAGISRAAKINRILPPRSTAMARRRAESRHGTA